MNARRISYMLSIMMAMFLCVACESDDNATNKIDLTINVKTALNETNIDDFTSFKVELVSERDGAVIQKNLKNDGTVVVAADKGSYSIEVSGAIGEANYWGVTGMLQYNEDGIINIEVIHTAELYKGAMRGIVIKELFYNGGTYNGRMRHPDQYIIIANNSDKEINVAGLAIAQSSNMNSFPCNELTDLLPNNVVASNIYHIPDGNYILKAGEQYVIASSAINHSEIYEKNEEKDTGIPADLSGADFELADGDAFMTGSVTDNPEISNLVKISNNLPAGVTAWMHPYAIRPMFIFDGSNIDWNTFKNENKVTYNQKLNIKKEIGEYHGYKVPSNLIVDAVESTSNTTPFWGNYTSKTLPISIDKSYIHGTIEGCHHNTFMIRKSTVDGKLIDTNNSSNDMYIEHRSDFIGFPK